jgi:hypothetical protein
MKILFLHGWTSVPGGVKPTYLRDHGHEVFNPALPDEDFHAAVKIAQAEFDEHAPDVVVDSSRGGAVAMSIQSGKTPLVLLCPAWKRWGEAKTVKPGTVILHSKADDVIPFHHSVELVRESRLPLESLIAVGYEHRLADVASLKAMLDAVEGRTTTAPQAIPHEAGVPRQFGIGMLLAITTMYAVLFAILRAYNARPSDYIVAGLFFMAIGLAQMFLFKAQGPRRASVIAGACILAAWSAINYFLGYADLLGPVEVTILGAILGALEGYVAGVIIAGIFLLADKAEYFLRKAGIKANREVAEGPHPPQ